MNGRTACDESALRERDLSALRLVRTANSRLRAVLCTLARRGVLLRQREPERARQVLCALAPWPFYKGGQFLFDLLEWEDFMLDGDAPPVLPHRELADLLDPPLRWLAATATGGVPAPPPLRHTAAALDLPLRWLAATARSTVHGVLNDLDGLLATTRDAEPDDHAALPPLESGFYLYQDVVLGLFDIGAPPAATGEPATGEPATGEPTAGEPATGEPAPAEEPAPPDEGPPPPIEEVFDVEDVADLVHDWTLLGDATLAGADGLQLTPNERSKAGTALLNTPFPSKSGVSVEFDYYASGGGGDGFAVYLVDGAHETGVGGYGAGLGYSRGHRGDVAGVTKGYLGIGFDNWGNFSTALAGPTDDDTRRPGSVVLRGSGDRTEGFRRIRGVRPDGGIGAVWEDGARVRVVVVDAVVTVQLTRGGVTTTVFDGVDLKTAPGQVAVPDTFKLGLSASTGDQTSWHRVRNLVIAMPPNDAPPAPDRVRSVVG